MKNRYTVDINGMLSFANLIIFALIGYALFFYSSTETNPYIDNISLVLGLLLCIQTQIFLYIERKSPDPFILVLVYVTSVYYSLRLFTLTLYPYSDVFDRIGVYSSGDSNFALLIIFIANTCLAAGLFSHQFGVKSPINIINYCPKQPAVGIVILSLLIILNSSSFLQNQEGIWKILILPLLFFNPINVLIILAAYIFVFRVHIAFIYKLTLVALASILIIVQTLGGSRSGILTYLHYLFFFTIVLVPLFHVRLRTFVIMVGSFPIILIFMGLIYATATISRGDLHEQGANLTIAQRVNVINEVVQNSEYTDQAEVMVARIFARTGFFDFTSEIIAHKEEYSDIFTLSSYFKSVVDNILTPGFDIFDHPRIGNGLSQIYREAVRLSKTDVSEAYQSDQISLIGEMFSLFGYFSFLILFLLGRALRKMYLNTSGITPFNLALKRVFLMIIFHSSLLSFGLDWLLLDLIVIVVTVLLMKRLFIVVRTNPADGTQFVNHEPLRVPVP